MTSTNAFSQDESGAEDEKKSEKKIRIDWEQVPGVIKYRIEIKDSLNMTALEEETSSNFLEFSLPPGEYKLRIGAINKFYKIAAWSDWQNIEIKKGKPKRRPPGKKKPRREFKYVHHDPKLFKIGLGMAYYYLFPVWSEKYENSYINVHLNFGIYFGGFYKLKKYWFFRHFGMDLDIMYNYFNGIQNPILKSSLQNIAGGMNLYMRSDFKIPMNLIFRVGAGASFSIQNFEKYSLAGVLLLKGEGLSLDAYYKIGLALEFRVSKLFYFELGTDFFSIAYQGEMLQSIRPFILLGCTF